MGHSYSTRQARWEVSNIKILWPNMQPRAGHSHSPSKSDKIVLDDASISPLSWLLTATAQGVELSILSLV